VGAAWGTEVTGCVFGTICVESLKVEGFADYRKASKSILSLNSESSDTVALTYTFDYATSSASQLAGNKSTMFLTPALNVKFSKSNNISFDSIACAGTKKEVITWSLDSEKNQPVLCDGAWVNQFLCHVCYFVVVVMKVLVD
jgi:hypothetical protein